MKILVTGASGFVAGSVIHFGVEQHEIHALSRKSAPLSHSNLYWHEIGIDDHKKLSKLFHEVKPDAIIHVAAIADIDFCTQHPEIAHAVNVEYSETLAKLAQEHKARMVYISTDNVYEGTHAIYSESSDTNPVNYYGQTKLDAERIVLNTVGNATVGRLALVMGFPIIGGVNSFLMRMVEKWEAGESVGVPGNEIRSPIDLVTAGNALIELATLDSRGVVLLGGLDQLPRIDLVKQLAQGLGYSADLVHSFDPSQLPGRADRPEKVLFDMTHTQAILKTPIVNIAGAIGLIKPFKQ